MKISNTNFIFIIHFSIRSASCKQQILLWMFFLAVFTIDYRSSSMELQPNEDCQPSSKKRLPLKLGCDSSSKTPFRKKKQIPIRNPPCKSTFTYTSHCYSCYSLHGVFANQYMPKKPTVFGKSHLRPQGPWSVRSDVVSNPRGVLFNQPTATCLEATKCETRFLSWRSHKFFHFL